MMPWELLQFGQIARLFAGPGMPRTEPEKVAADQDSRIAAGSGFFGLPMSPKLCWEKLEDRSSPTHRADSGE